MVGAIISLIYDEARRIWCYRWLAAITSLLLFLAAAAVVLTRPNIYDAWGQIYVSPQTPVAAAAHGVSLVGDSYGNPNVIARTLLNDQSLEHLIRVLDPAAGRMTKAQMAEAVAGLKNQIQLRGGEDGFFEIHVKDYDPHKAQRIVQLVLETFVARTINRNTNELQQAGDFLDAQIASYETMLGASSAKLADFRRRHPEFTPTGFVEPGASSDLLEAEATFQALLAQTPSRGGASSAAGRVAALQEKLAGLRTQYTDEHPDVVITRRQLGEAMAEQARAARAPQAAADPALAAARRRLAEAQRRAAPRVVRATVSPELQGQWAELQKNDEVLRITYQQLLTKREGARVAQTLYGADGSGKYQVTRRPTVPETPIPSNGKLYLAMAAVMAIGGGLAAAYLRAAMIGIFVAPRELERAFELPVVGTVSWEPAWSTGDFAHPGTLASARATALRTFGRVRPAQRIVSPERRS